MDDRRLVTKEVAAVPEDSQAVTSCTRRILLTAGCGVFCLGAAFCSSRPSLPNSPAVTLTIGIAEGTAPGTDGGPRSLANALSQEGLTQLGTDGRPEPRIAERWQFEDGARTLRVTLRDGITFHSGNPLDAEAVVKSLTRTLSDRNNLIQYSSLSDIQAVRAVSKREVVFEMSRPSAFLPEDLEVSITEALPGEVSGTGPFEVKELSRSGVSLTRFAQYHRGTPHIENISIQPFPTLRTAWTSLLRGEIHMVTNVSPDAVEFVRTSDLEVVSYPRRYQYMIVLNSRVAPFSSRSVRRAASIAIDRQQLVERVLRGRGTPATSPLWPQHWAYDREILGGGFEPDLSRLLLDQAGFRPDKERRTEHRPQARFRFTCLVPKDFLVLERLALEVQRQLFGVGIDMDLEEVPIRELTRRVNDGDFQASILDMVSGPSIGRAHIFWRSRKTYQGLNVFGYENRDAEQLFEVLRSSTNEAAIRSSVSALQRVFNEDPPALFLAWNERAQAVRRSFETVHDPGRDPLSTLWQWRPLPLGQLAQR